MIDNSAAPLYEGSDTAETDHAPVVHAAAHLDLDSGFRMGEFDVKPRHGVVHGQNRTLHLEPKVMGVLVLLARNVDAVVSRNQFLDEVWQGVVVGDEVLTRAIHLLRRDLNDSRSEPRYIQTVPRRGYRLIAPVRAAAGIAPDAAGRGDWVEWILFALICVGISLLLAVDWTERIDGAGAGTQPEAAAIGVIGFSSYGRDADRFTTALLGDIMAELAQSTGGHIVYRENDPVRDPCTLANLLGTESMLTGRLDRRGDRVRVAFQWSGSADCYVRDSGTYALDAADLGDSSRAIALEIATRIASWSGVAPAAKTTSAL